MNFQDLNKVEKHDFYIDVAIKKSQEKAKQIRTSKLNGTRLDKSRYVETRKIEVIKDSVVNQMSKITKSFPSIDDLPEFYVELIKCTLDYPTLKKSLGAIGWVSKRIEELFRIYSSKINKCTEMTKINGYRREFFGRFSSVLKQIKKELDYLENARKTMKGFPTIKTSIPTVSIAGFPNIGKTTLLYKLTGSKPEINDYAFTTKGINVSYYIKDNKKVQMLDTPGTLDRFNKMNSIEKQAYLAMKFVSDQIIYVFDLTETYPIKSQIKLYKELMKLEIPTICYLSKTDLLDKKTIDGFELNKQCIKNIDVLKKELDKLVME